MQKLLKGAKFIYSNGLHSIFVKPGGQATALKDFNSIRRATLVTDFPLPENMKVCIPHDT